MDIGATPVKKLLLAFNEFKVEYLLVGGLAVNFHGYQRSTLDMDLWINPIKSNLINIKDALIALGYEADGAQIAINELASGNNIGIDRDGSEVDIIQLFSTNITFQEAYKNCQYMPLSETRIPVINYEHLIKSKIHAGRNKDYDDVKNLQELKEKGN